jgi:hypothetical protein
MTAEELKAIRERLDNAEADDGIGDDVLMTDSGVALWRETPTIVRALLAEVERLQTERRECPRCLYEFRLDGVPVDQ